MQRQLTVSKFLRTCAWKFKGLIAFQIMLETVWAVDVVLRPYLLKLLIDTANSIDHSQALEKLALPAMLYVSMWPVMIFAYRGVDMVWLYINPGLKTYIGNMFMSRMMRHSTAVFQDLYAGNLGAKIKEVMSSVPDLIKMLMDQYGHIMSLIIAIFTFQNISQPFAIGLVVWLTVTIVLTFYQIPKAQDASRVAAKHRTHVIGQMIDTLSNIANVRLFTGEESESKRLRGDLTKWAQADKARDWTFIKMYTLHGVILIIYQAVSMYFLVTGFQEGTVTAGDFVLVVSVNLSILGFVQKISEQMSLIAQYYGAIVQGVSIVFRPWDILDKPHAGDLVLKKGQIDFSKVKFAYPGANQVFEKLSVTFKPKEKVGLVGFSGVGKSTLINLVLRLFDVNEGSVTIDGQDIRDVTQASLRRHIGVIPQDPVLFHRSLLENIRYGSPKATDAQVKEAAKQAFAHEFIEQLPNGYDSQVGERGVKLSGGQRQRIAIARAMLKNAPILVLDEATSQLDSVTEKQIQQSLKILMKGKTTLVIAHRLSTLLHMDRILVFGDQGIVQDGSHKELLSQEGTYKDMWNAQVGGFLPEDE